MTTQEINYEHWSDFLYRVSAVCSPAELQGMLSGTLAGGQRPDPETWCATAQEFMDIHQQAPSEELKAALSALYELTLRTLQAHNYEFQLLLPKDAVPLSLRTQALAQWCQGFLHGLGSAGEGIAQRLDQDSQDAVRDFAAITSLDTDAGESEENEVYFTQLVEFVRLTVFNIYAQLNASVPSENVH